MNVFHRSAAATLCLPIFSVLTLLACGAPEASDSPADIHVGEVAAETADPLGDWRPQFEEMAGVLGLEGPDRERLEAAFLARDRELSTWLDGEEGRRFLRLESELRDAAADRDLTRVRAITDEASPLRRRFEALVDSTYEQVLASLSAEDRDTWDAYQLYQRMFELMEPLGLSEEQNGQLAGRSFEFLDQARRNNEPNPEAAAFLEYERWAERAILDDTQRAMYAETKRENPLRSLR